MDGISPTKAKEILDNITGPNGLIKAVADLSKREKDIRTQISVLTGELNGMIKSRKLLERLAREWGLDAVPATDVDNTTHPESTGGDDDPELKRLISEGKCKYRDKDTKKWCQRVLKTKKEKEAGYCTVCMNRIGLTSKDTSAKKKPRKQKSVKNRKK